MKTQQARLSRTVRGRLAKRLLGRVAPAGDTFPLCRPATEQDKRRRAGPDCRPDVPTRTDLYISPRRPSTVHALSLLGTPLRMLGGGKHSTCNEGQPAE